MTTATQIRHFAFEGPNSCPWQKPAFLDKSRILLLTGAAGGGKTRLAAEKMNWYCQAFPGASCAIVRKYREWIRESCGIEMTKAAGFAPNAEGKWAYPNGSRIISIGMGDYRQREGVRSAEFDLAWMEEATQFTEQDFNELGARMRGTAGPWRQLILSTNPDAPTHWVNRRMINGGEASVHISRASDNPNTGEDYDEFLDGLTGVQRQRLLEGKWVQAEGIVYNLYDADVHLIDPFEIPKDWKRHVSVDFGMTNPTSVSWYAEDGDGRLYQYRQTYKTQETSEYHARRAAELSAGETISTCVCDSESPEGIAQFRAHFFRGAIGAKKGPGSVEAGIDLVTARLKVQKDGKPRVFFLRGNLVEADRRLADVGLPTSTVEEIVQYVRKPMKDARVQYENRFEGEDHGLDELRMLVQHLDTARANRFVRHRPSRV